jgi:sulfate adenylyltransferase subunit 2
VHTNRDGLAQGINPFDTGSNKYTTVMKTHALLQALKAGGFDAAFGGARRDEEKSRAKERVYSFRDRNQQWDPKNQRPELWNLYNGRSPKGESIRAFPLSNWTELDVWQYICSRTSPSCRCTSPPSGPVVERDGIADHGRRRPHAVPRGRGRCMRRVRFRTLGCYPLSGAVESDATTVPEIIQEMLSARSSERQGRLIDHDEEASMEQKKREGYF